LDFLCKNCCAHFRRVLEYLEEAGIQYVLDRFLVRGLDYYNRTVFEFSAPDPAAKESPEGIRPSVLALGGGGRYDPLMKLLGGPDTPAVGVAFGVDRLAEFTERIHPDTITETVDVFLIQIGDVAKTTLIKALGELRKARVRIGFDLGRDSLRAQLKSADRLKARFSVILGEKEVFDRTFILRDMATGIQETFPQTRLVEVLKGHLHHHVS
jgi:histidyl-tRNA synthetase